MTEQAVRATAPERWIDKLERDSFDSEGMARRGRLLAVAGAILNAPGAVIRDLKFENHLSVYTVALILATVLFSALYGAILGMFQPGIQILYSAVKVPIVVLGSAALCTPTFYVFNSILGSRLSFRQSLATVLLLSASAALVLVAFAPIGWFFTVSTDGMAFLTILHVAFFLLAAFYGMRMLCVARKYMNYIDRTQTAIHGGFLFVWFLILIFVGLQMAYFVRPLMEPGDFLTGERGLFFDVIAGMFDGPAG